MPVKATAKSIRISPRKVRLVTRLLAGKDVTLAEQELRFLQKGASVTVLTLLRSAVANAENNFEMDKDNLFIKEIMVNEGPTFKRWRARSRGMAAPIKKRSSHISIILEEKQPGKKKDKSVSTKAYLRKQASVDKKGGSKPKVVKVKSRKDIGKLMKAEVESAEKDGKKAKEKTGYHQKKRSQEKKQDGSKGFKGAVEKLFRRKSSEG